MPPLELETLELFGLELLELGLAKLEDELELIGLELKPLKLLELGLLEGENGENVDDGDD
ncbi:hypothetical protein AGMMS49593_06230 [Endomicrobiia bacterium]|nr:hypothetical protein AGMMS49593_06230 [Endomicrobiia bacterium]